MVPSIHESKWRSVAKEAGVTAGLTSSDLNTDADRRLDIQKAIEDLAKLYKIVGSQKTLTQPSDTKSNNQIASEIFSNMLVKLKAVEIPTPAPAVSEALAAAEKESSLQPGK